MLLFPCGLMGDGYDCQDPDVPPDCGATPSPAAFYGYPDCNATMFNFQNSDCNDDLNNAECGWDGGMDGTTAVSSLRCHPMSTLEAPLLAVLSLLLGGVLVCTSAPRSGLC